MYLEKTDVYQKFIPTDLLSKEGRTSILLDYFTVLIEPILAATRICKAKRESERESERRLHFL